MKKYYITKHIMVVQTVEAASASEAVKKFEADVDKLYIDGNAPALDLSFGSSGEPDTVEEVVLVEYGDFNPPRFVSELSLVGYISGGDFVPKKDFPDA